MQHIEFFHKHHFEYRYHRKKARPSLSRFIDFFWETRFEELWPLYPQGFCDALFPNVGYTYLINLGTPFVMQLGEDSFEIKSDGFLPRHRSLTCHHAAGNRIFGIKFKVSPVVFQKKINFSEYREYIFPLAYLIDRKLVEKVKEAGSFQKRVELISGYYDRIIETYSGSLTYVDIVTEILHHCYQRNECHLPVEGLAARYHISPRTLQRYFEAATSISSKQALQIMRIRKAVAHLTDQPDTFRLHEYGYYDYSHFHKHLKDFIGPAHWKTLGPQLLKSCSAV